MNSNELTPAERDRMHEQLIKLGDLIAEDDEWGAQRKYYNSEYRKIAKILYPEMYPAKKRKPNQAFVRTLKECDCGNKGWKFARHNTGNVSIYCPNCGKNTGECKSNIEARDKWNLLFQ